MQWYWTLRYRVLRSKAYRALWEYFRKPDWYDEEGVLVTDRGEWTEISVTDKDVDVAGAKDQIAAEEMGYA